MTEFDQEMKRIEGLADRLYADYKDERDWEQMLACILRRLDANYFSRDPHDRETTKKLLTRDLKEKAMLLHKVVGASTMSPLLKARVCGSVESFLRDTCEVGPDEMKKFKSTCSFDPATFNLFEGLEA